MPILTLTARRDLDAAPDALELNFRSSDSAKRQILKSVDLDKLRGRWVDVEVRTHYKDQTGYLNVHMTDVQTGEAILRYTRAQIDMYRVGNELVRPKWGIYRSLKAPEHLRNERVLFADFCIAEGSDTCSGTSVVLNQNETSVLRSSKQRY